MVKKILVYIILTVALVIGFTGWSMTGSKNPADGKAAAQSSAAERSQEPPAVPAKDRDDPGLIDFNSILDGIGQDKEAALLEHKKADINGDGTDDDIYLIGIQPKNYTGLYQENMKIIILDGKSGELTSIPADSGNGYWYDIFAGDFDGDKIKDILFSVNNDMAGGAGQYTFTVYSCKNGKVSKLFDNEKLRNELEFSVNFKDGYKVEINCPGNNKSFTVDVSDKKATYRKLGLYDGEDKLIKPEEGWVDNYNRLAPEDVDKDGVLELKGQQYVSGYGHSDEIGTLSSVLKWDRKKQNWIVTDIDFKRTEK